MINERNKTTIFCGENLIIILHLNKFQKNKVIFSIYCYKFFIIIFVFEELFQSKKKTNQSFRGL
jgi:hypothetical protein